MTIQCDFRCKSLQICRMKFRTAFVLLTFYTAIFAFTLSVAEQNKESCICVPVERCQITAKHQAISERYVEKFACNNSSHVCCLLESAPSYPCGFRNKPKQGKTSTEMQNAGNGEFPWMVAVLKEKNEDFVFHCGGSLIHSKFVLTAAHSIALLLVNNPKLKIRTGEWLDGKLSNSSYHQERDVYRYILHPDFYVGNLRNDIALLQLQQPVELTRYVYPICLPKPEASFTNIKCTLSGWGKTSIDDKNFKEALRKIELKVVEPVGCVLKLRDSKLGKAFRLHRSFICAGGENKPESCQGDGGSPLVCPMKYHGGRYVQAGIVSWGIGCNAGFPGVFTNVARFRAWIDSIVFENRHETPV